MSKLSEIFNREIDLIKKDENTLGIVLVGSSKDLDFEKDIKINDIDLFIFTKEQDENQIRINKEISSIEFDLNYISIKGCEHFIETKEYFFLKINDGKIIYEDKGIGFDKEAIALRNVSGEVLGAKMAVEFAINNNYKEVTIAYDYQGIESWALGTWKRNNKITSEYNEYMQNKMKEINIRFKKIKGHSGHKYNDLADKLAKEALGIK